MDDNSSKKKTRIVSINLDDETDKELDDSQSDVLPITSQSSQSLDMASDVSRISDKDLNRTASDLDIELIEEVINEDTQNRDQINDNESVDESGVESIKSYLKSDSIDWNSSTVGAKRKKSNSGESKSKKKLINKLNEENLNLYRIIEDLKQQLEVKTNYIMEQIKSRPRIVCFTCGSGAVHKFFCCLNGCYCSEKCKETDFYVNKHFIQCIRLRKEDNDFSRSLRSLRRNCFCNQFK